MIRNLLLKKHEDMLSFMMRHEHLTMRKGIATWMRVKMLCVISFVISVGCFDVYGQLVRDASGTLLVDRSKIEADTILPNAGPDLLGDMLKHDKNYWYRALLKGRLDLKDEKVRYPRFVKFCVDAYNWADKTFNSYDPDYVVGTGKRWKIFLKSDNWFDSYSLRLQNDMKIRMMSDMCYNLGGYISYMAVSLGYSFDVGNLISGDPITRSKWDFQFTCALLSANLYYNKNTGGTNILRFGDYNEGKFINYEFSNLKLESYGVDVYYFFNNKKYSHGAAYSFSKIQKRSAGSLIAGLTISSQDVDIDFSTLPADMKTYLPDQNNLDYRFRYYDYCILAGYGYNWVISKHWLFNISALPSIGFKHCLGISEEGVNDLYSVSMKGLMALVYNHKDWFAGFQGKFDAHWYSSRNYSFVNAIGTCLLTMGWRF